MRPRAFMLELSPHDVTPAARFGEIVVLFERHGSRSSIWDPAFVEELLIALEARAYDPEVDYFVVVGHMVPVVIAAAALVSKFGRVRALLYSSIERDYTPRYIGDTTHGQAIETAVHEGQGVTRPSVRDA